MKFEKFEGKSYQLIDDGGVRLPIKSTRPKRPASNYTIKYWKNYYRLTFETQQEIDTFRAGILGNSNDTRTIWTDDDKTYNYISKTYFDGKHVRQIGSGFAIYSMGQRYSFESGKCCIALLVDEEAEDIIKPSPTEKKTWAEQDERNNNNKIIKTFFGNNITDLAKKYHLTLSEYNDATVGLDFNRQSDIVEFFKIAVNELIMAKLKEQGLEGTINEKAITKGFSRTWIYGRIVDNIKINQTALQ